MKKWLAILLCLALTAALTACGRLTRDEAYAKALQDAGLTENDVTLLTEGQEEDEFYFEFSTDTDKYTYQIDEDGKIETKVIASLKPANDDASFVDVPDTDPNADAPLTAPLTEAQALEAAYAHFQVAEADVVNLRVKTERDDGREVFDIEFDAGTREYSCEIDISTGEIVSSDIDNRD